MSAIEKVVERTVVEETTVGHRCDICGRVVSAHEELPYHKRPGSDTRFYCCEWSHGDWGNDSYESREGFDVCEECFGGFLSRMKEYVAKHPRTAKVTIECEVGRVESDKL